MAFLFLVTLFLEPVAEFTEILDQTQTAVAGWRKVLDVLDTPIEVADPPDGVDLPDGPPRIEVEHVSYGYKRYGVVTASESWALTDVSAVIEPATRVALVGATGSGKSTLAKLLVRLADPTEGRVLVHGIDLRTVAFASLRSRPRARAAGDVPVRHDDPRERPLRDAGDAGEDDVRLAFVELGLDDWLDAMPHGLDTKVGERGEHLSVGERQLVALARAYVANPTCLLLDEATLGGRPRPPRPASRGRSRA